MTYDLPPPDRVEEFSLDEAGAVTVDYVVLTGAIIGLILAVVMTIGSEVVSSAKEIGGDIVAAQAAGSALNGGGDTDESGDGSDDDEDTDESDNSSDDDGSDDSGNDDDSSNSDDEEDSDSSDNDSDSDSSDDEDDSSDSNKSDDDDSDKSDDSD